MRFGIEVPQDAPFPALVERWQRAEALGFDHLWVADHSADTRTDHSGDYRNLDGTWFDGWTVLAVMAKETTHIRIGTLVSNPVLRPPALLAKEAPPVDKPEADASSVEPTWWGTDEEEAPVDKPDASSATERVEPPGSEATPIAGEASRLIGGGGALPTEDSRDEAFGGEEEGKGAPDPAAPADAAVGGAAIGAGAVGEASGPGETIEDVARKAILDLPGATGDVVEHMDDPAANAVYDGVETPSFMKDDLEGGLGDVGDEDVVEPMDDPVVDQ